MKKIVLLLAVILTAGGMVWAQYEPPDTAISSDIPSVFPGFDVVGGVRSVENRFAPGFNTMVEDYIDPAFFDPKIGTFLFLGGDPGNNFLDGSIALGAAKTLGSFYVGAYYKGNIIGLGNSRGVTGNNPDDDDRVYKNSSIIWNNNIALLFGVAGMGFRFDIIDSEQKANTNITYGDDYTTTVSNKYGPKIALSWGSHFGNLYPWAKAGFKFPDIVSVGGVDLGDPDLGTNGKKATKSGNGVFNIEAGTLYDFSGGNLTDMVFGALTFGLLFKDSYEGDSGLMTALGADTLAGRKAYTYGGAWGLNLNLNYRKTFELGKFTMKITPNLNMDMRSQSNDNSFDGNENPKPTWFTLEPGIQLGVKYQPFDKLAFFTGLDLSLLLWRVYATPGGDVKDGTTKWDIRGTQWSYGKNFGLGMAWYPVKGLVVSTGLTSVLNAFVKFDVENMSVSRGSIFEDTNTENIGDWAMVTLGKIFNSFELTVTWTF